MTPAAIAAGLAVGAVWTWAVALVAYHLGYQRGAGTTWLACEGHYAHKETSAIADAAARRGDHGRRHADPERYGDGQRGGEAR